VTDKERRSFSTFAGGGKEFFPCWGFCGLSENTHDPLEPVPWEP